MERGEYGNCPMTLTIILPSHREIRVCETKRICTALFPGSQVIIAHDFDGRGKGWALRQGLLEAKGSIIAFLDGDGDIHPRMLYRLLPFISDYDIVVGRKSEQKILSRRALTFLSRIYIRAMFNIGVDTQTGIKLFRSNCIPTWECDGFASDLEILAKARRMGLRIAEVPVECNITKKKGIGIIYRALVESWRIWWKLNIQEPK
jgi:glycosyltransferase involved in cell wall biosynthesis